MQKPFTNISKLIDFLELDEENKKKILKKSSFNLLLPFHLAKKIKKNDISDPIFRQFVPLVEKENQSKEFVQDPLLEKKFQKGKLLKKYKNRALLITTSSCAVNCIFCFRRFFEKTEDQDFDTELEIIRKDKALDEIILSGGDPLALNNKNLKELLLKLDDISHIKRIRFHTRFIIGYPKRINAEFLNILKTLTKQIVFVFHINHPKEIDDLVITSIKKLKKLHILLFNQTVLLKDINDNFETLKALNSLLFDIGVVPYYLHQLDKIKGAAHFDVDIEKGKELISKLRENQSGFMVPNYVKEIPGEKSKSLIERDLP